MTDKPILLVLTVGGSPNPLASALKALRPDIVVFLVSSATATSPSSRNQIDDGLGGGLKYADGCPQPDRTSIFEIPPDDPDKAYSLCRAHLAALARSHPDHQIIADYTGGTKSMTGALLMAAFAQDNVQVQFMVGKRADLVQIEEGTERPQLMPSDFVRLERDFSKIGQAVAGYEYSAAFALADQLKRKIGNLPKSSAVPASFRKSVEQSRDWLSVMADWDAFRHAKAAKMPRASFENGTWLAESLQADGLYQPLLDLADLASKQPSWTLCADLWLNALRCGSKGRFDDAIARLYRLVEASAQAQLFELDGVLTSHVPVAHLPRTLLSKINPPSCKTHVQLPLSDTVEHLFSRKGGEAVAAGIRSFIDPTTGQKILPHWLGSRNHSILAHGFKSIQPETWTVARDWVQTNLRPFWQAHEPPQLPTKLPSF
jgi:CRISPR-associated protein (TIGR02710 family)